MKQLVLLHGVPSDIKVPSVVGESSDKESSHHEAIAPRRFSWKSKPVSSSFTEELSSMDDSSSAQKPQVSHTKLERMELLFYAAACSHFCIFCPTSFSGLHRLDRHISQILYSNVT
jgi:hypothetical protein